MSFSPDYLGGGFSATFNALTVDGDATISDGYGLVIGNSSQVTTVHTHEFQVLGTTGDDAGMTLGRFSANAQGAHIDFVKSRNATIGSSTILQDNDVIGVMQIMPDDGVDFTTLAGRFKAEVDDASPAAGDIGIAWVWDAMPGGGGAIQEQMRLSALGALGIGVGPLTNMAKGDLVLEGGSLVLKEITTPTADANYGKIYTKSDNNLYFQDGAGVESTVQTSESSVAEYGEMYLNNNSTATTIEQANQPVGVRYFSQGSLNGFTFGAGSTGAITAYADYSGTVAGTVKATDVGHGLTTGDFVVIRGTTNYNGVFQITKIDDDNFYFTDTWVADDGASDWEQPSYLQHTSGTSIDFAVQWCMSSTKGAGTSATATYSLYVNTTQDAPSIVQRQFSTSDVGAFSGQAIVTLSAGDRVFMVMQSSNTDDITNNYGSVQIRQQ